MTSSDIYAILASKPHNPHWLNRYIKFIETVSGLRGESHHICPKAKDLFPEYKSFKQFPWNKIKLSLREHYIAHWMLWKTYGGSQAQAFKLMCCRLNKKSSRLYESVKAKQAEMMRGMRNPAHTTSIFKTKNPNVGGELSRQSWARADSSRRLKQAHIMAENNRRTKSKPKEIRLYVCSECGCQVIREEHTHHPIKEHVFCSHSHRAAFFNKRRNNG